MLVLVIIEVCFGAEEGGVGDWGRRVVGFVGYFRNDFVVADRAILDDELPMMFFFLLLFQRGGNDKFIWGGGCFFCFFGCFKRCM